MPAIRPGTVDDLAAVAAIQAASPAAAQWSPSDYLGHDFLVALDREQVAAFLVARSVAPGEREILNLAVAPEFRRRGFARHLLSVWLAGVPGDVFLEVRASNEVALKFYNSMGFQQVSLRQKYYKSPTEAAIVMKFHSC